LIKYRFKDYYKYKKSGDIAHFGAGRLGLLSDYFEIYMNASFSKKILGVDIGGYVDKNKKGYLHLGLRLDPHNDYMEFLLNNGAIGLGLLVAFLFVIFRFVLRVLNRSADLLCLRLGAIMGGMFLIYLVGSIAGMIFRVLPMTCFALLFGSFFGVVSEKKEIIIGLP
jgi:O-antigen ligase